MLSVLFARLDRRIADLVLARARRQWPMLRLVPRPCARWAILPAVTLARQDAVRAAAVGAMLVGALLVLSPMF